MKAIKAAQPHPVFIIVDETGAWIEGCVFNSAAHAFTNIVEDNLKEHCGPIRVFEFTAAAQPEKKPVK